MCGKSTKKRIQVGHWRVKQGVSLNYTSLNWPQAGEALTLSRIQMWRSQGWGPTAPPDPQVESRQAGPAVSSYGGGADSVWPLRGCSPKAEPQYCKRNPHCAFHQLIILCSIFFMGKVWHSYNDQCFSNLDYPNSSKISETAETVYMKGTL